MAVPMILAMTGQTLMHFLDGIFLARYSNEAIAAAGPAGMTSWLLISLFNGAAAFTSTFVAQYKGAGRTDHIGSSVWQGIYFGIITGAAIALFGTFFGYKIFALSRHDPAIVPLESTFFIINCWAAPLSIISSAISGFFSGRGDMKRLMAIQVAGQAVNGVLAYGMIFGRFGFSEGGIAGAATASLIAQGFVCLTLLAAMFHADRQGKFGVWAGRRFNHDLFVRFFRFDVPNGFRFFFEMLAWTVFLLFVGRIGEMDIAATNIAWRINMFAFFPMIGLSIAVQTIVGQAQGMDRPDISAKCGWRGLIMTQIWMIVFGLLFIIFPEPLVSLFREDGQASATMMQTLDLTKILLRYVAVYCLLDGISIVTVGALQGAGDTRWTMVASVIMHGGFIIVMALMDYMHAGLHAFWAVAPGFAMLIALVWLSRFISGKWKTMRVIEEPAGISN